MNATMLKMYFWLYVVCLSFNLAKAVQNSLATPHQDFALDIYKQIGKDNKGKNVFLSPISISTAFGMVHIGARAGTQTQMKNVLHLNTLDSDKTINEAYKQLMRKLKSDANNFTLYLANRLFGSDEFQFNEQFLQESKDYFHASLDKLDFSQRPDDSRIKINKWVERQTNDKIKDLLHSGSIDSFTTLVIVNAIYFKAGWKHTFNMNLTKTTPFFISKTEQASMDMMYLSNTELNYYDSKELNCQILELPYLDNQISMFIFLPREIEGLTKLEDQVTSDNLAQTLRKVKSRFVAVWLPKFQMDQDISLKKFLQKLGMVDLFTADSDLSGIGGPDCLLVSDAIHKACVNVDEVGTEAAAATAAIFTYRSLHLPEINYTVDHPFLFLIYEKTTETILFLGRIVRPPTSKDSIGTFGDAAALTGGTVSKSSAPFISAVFGFVTIVNFYYIH